MNRDDIIRMAEKAGMALGFTQGIAVMNHKNLERFATLVAAAEREAECHCGLMARVNELEEALLFERDRKLEEGWRQCAIGQGTTQFCAVTEEAVKAEREACLSILRDMEGKKWHTVIHGGEMKGVSLHDAYAAIRARGEK